MPIATLSQQEVAQLMGWQEITFQRHYKKLVDEHGFPVRLPGGRFYAPAIERWMWTASGFEEPAEQPSPVDAQRKHLEQLFGKGRAA